MTEHRRNVQASIRARLLNEAKRRGENYEFTVTRYAGERLLYRLGCSRYQQKFVLKGASLFALWTGALHRATRDLDFLGRGDPSPKELVRIFKEIAGLPVEDDGLQFRVETIRAESMREDEKYAGTRIALVATLGSAIIPVQVDVGFGDAVTPDPVEATMTTYLNQPAPCLLVYPRETVIAEKAEAIIDLGMANSRLKDFYDIWYLCGMFDFDAAVLQSAVAATFTRRATPIPTATVPSLSPAFTEDDDRQRQWTAFLKRSGVNPPNAPALTKVAQQIAAFLRPIFHACASGSPEPGLWSCQDRAWHEKP